MSPTPPLLGIDIGTSSTKGVLVDGGGRVIARSQRAHTSAMPRPGHVEQDPEGTWWGDVAAIARELTTVAAGNVDAVCVTGLGPCLVVCDGAGHPLRPAILYGVDTRATAEIAWLEEQVGADEVLRRSGSPLTSQAVGPKILWVRRNEPDVWAAAARIHSSGSYVVERLTGQYVLDHHSASQFGPLYDIAEHRWAQDMVELVAPGVPMPALAWPDEVVGAITPAAAEATGLPTGTPVAAGTIDAWAEAAGSGADAPGDLFFMYGSTMFMVLTSTGLAPDPRIWNTVGTSDGRYSRAAGMAASGALTAWFADLVDGDYPDLLAQAAQSPPGAHGLVTLPYFAGERTPLFDPAARGVVAGLTLRHTRGDLYRSLLESTAFGVRHNLETMLADAPGPPHVVAAGGGTRGDLWPQIVSDVTGLTQEMPAVRDGASYGAALFAARAVGVAPGEGWRRVDGVVAPGEERAEVYHPLYRAYRDLYPATADVTHRLAALQLGHAW